MNEKDRERIKEILLKAPDIGCCSDKSVYAIYMIDALDELGIPFEEQPQTVVQAIKDLLDWEDCAKPRETIEAYLRGIMEPKNAGQQCTDIAAESEEGTA